MIHTIIYFLDYGKNFGGATKTLLQQAELMKHAGYRTIFFFSDYYGRKIDDGHKRLCSKIGIKWEWATYQISSQPEDIDLVCINRNYETLKEKVNGYNPDILHSVQINACVELISRELRIPHIMNIYQLNSDFFTINYLNIFPHYHICDSLYYARKWESYLKTDSTCIRTVTDVERKKSSVNFFKKSLNYICVGTFSERKNQLTVIKAFHKALQHGLKGNLILYGNAEGQYAADCIQYIKDNILEQKIIIAGFCTNMNERYVTSDALISGSKIESFPNVVTEAMANGLAIISTPVAGVPEIIQDGINGYLTVDYSVEAIYKKIIELEQDFYNGTINKILINMEESFYKFHTPKIVKQQLINYYCHVAEDYPAFVKLKDNSKLPQIEDIRAMFGELLHTFSVEESKFTDSFQIAAKLWYFFHIKTKIMNALSQKAEFYIWGTGKYGIVVKELLDVFVPMIHIGGYVDSKKKGYFLGYQIYAPNEILQKENMIIFIAALNGQDEIVEKLKLAGKFFNIDYFILAPRKW